VSRDARELGGAWTTSQTHACASPSPELAGWVDHYWSVTWCYPEPYRQLIVPYPSVQLTFRASGADAAASAFEAEGARVQGVCSRHQVRVLEGTGRVFGVAFRPGGFRPFLRGPVSAITDRTLEAGEVFDGRLPAPVEVGTVEAFLLARLSESEPDPQAVRAAEAVSRIAAGTDITRVDALADELRTSVRRLQRLFAEYVGVGPKWVIRRYRLHEVTERLSAGARPQWARWAAELGYADQAHFARDFTRMFGESPTWYARRYPS
jgi:AraC-like DNA-binding protein